MLLHAFALLAVLALFVGACGGGDDDDDSSPTSAPAPTGATGATGTGGTGGAVDATAAAGSTGATGAATGSTGSATGAGISELGDLSELESYRWDVTLGGAGSILAGAGFPSVPGADTNQFTAEGAYIAPDQAQVEISVAGFEYKQTIKGDQQWTSIAGVTTGPVPTTDTAESLIYVSAFLDPASMVDGSSMQCGDKENVNGVEAVRCETTEEINDEIVAGLAGPNAQTEEASFVLWIAEEGNFVVKYEFSASGTVDGQPFEWSFVSNITDVNNVDSIDP